MKLHVSIKELSIKVLDIALEVEDETMLHPDLAIRDASFHAMVQLAAIKELGNIPIGAKIAVLQHLMVGK